MPHTLNPKTQPHNPTPPKKKLNPKPQTLNPQPQTAHEVIDFGEGNAFEKAVGFVAGTPGITIDVGSHTFDRGRMWLINL